MNADELELYRAALARAEGRGPDEAEPQANELESGTPWLGPGITYAERLERNRASRERIRAGSYPDPESHLARLQARLLAEPEEDVDLVDA